MDLQNEVMKVTLSCIKEAIQIFTKNPNYFLNEHDIQGYLYNMLNVNLKPIFGENAITTPAHSELSSEGDSGKSEKRPDISICNPEKFVRKSTGFEFEDSFTAIEIKYFMNGSRSRILLDLKNDYLKLCHIDEYDSFVLLFDHKALLSEKEIMGIQINNNDHENDIMIIYVTLSQVICVKNSKFCSIDD